MIKGALQRRLNELLRELLGEDERSSTRRADSINKEIADIRRAIRRCDYVPGEREFDTREEREIHYHEDE